MSGITRSVGARGARPVGARPHRALGLAASVVVAASLTAAVVWATSMLVLRWG